MTAELTIAVSIIVALIVTPIIAMVLVRVFIPLTPVIEEAEDQGLGEFESLRDFWEGMVPHLTELRDRLLKAGGAILAGAVLCGIVVFDDTLLGKRLPELIIEHFVPAPVRLQTVATAELFVSYTRIALLGGLALAMPVVVYQVIAFFAPALRPAEKRVLFTALPFVTELFLAGLVFGWFITIPAAVNFLLTFGASERIEVSPTVSNFISTVTSLLLWNGAIFELPAIIYLLARLGVVRAEMLARTRRYAIAVIVIVAAIITPTGDPWNLALLAVPMYLLYELGVLLARFVPKPDEQEVPSGAPSVGERR